jgi:hypothetical protein
MPHSYINVANTLVCHNFNIQIQENEIKKRSTTFMKENAIFLNAHLSIGEKIPYAPLKVKH